MSRLKSNQTTSIGWRCTPEQRDQLRAMLADRGIHPSQCVRLMLELIERLPVDDRRSVLARLPAHCGVLAAATGAPCDASPARRILARQGTDTARANGEALLDALASEEQHPLVETLGLGSTPPRPSKPTFDMSPQEVAEHRAAVKQWWDERAAAEQQTKNSEK